jgi:hypothetical protein
MFSNRGPWRSMGFGLVGVGLILLQSEPADAGAFFHRILGRRNCTQYYQQVPAQQPSGSTSSSYQSNSFEPGSSAPVASPAYNRPSTGRSSYDQFRGDRKALGKY